MRKAFLILQYRSLLCVMLLLAGVAFCQSCNQTTAKTPTLSWSLLDKDTNVVANGGNPIPNGSTFTIPDPDHHYFVTLQAQDPGGIKELVVWSNTASFQCSFISNQGGGVGSPQMCPSVTFSVGLPKETQLFNSSGTSEGFVQTPQPDPINPTVPVKGFRYNDIPCGSSQGHACSAFSGVVVQGTEISWSGTKTNATLTLNK